MEKPGDRLRRARTLKGLTQKQLAKEVGCARQTITRLELNRYKPTIDFADKVCRALGISLDSYWRGNLPIDSLRSRVLTAVEDAFDQE